MNDDTGMRALHAPFTGYTSATCHLARLLRTISGNVTHDTLTRLSNAYITQILCNDTAHNLPRFALTGCFTLSEKRLHESTRSGRAMPLMKNRGLPGCFRFACLLAPMGPTVEEAP
ncbi:uncharacterized protein YALI1_C00167g [Yarrowia lipolytica]|uniref:Uncharacterized protein n=1 Tax=Yarrowia lipolytica TaxID=4952 RepID=A0A1D8N928_YARLL|nr:hypothetical protein YALI1_C00167g [Yarrowia lipolytica]